MLRKILALAVGTVFSLNASAGYIQYNLQSPHVSGFFIQNTDDKSVAFYFLNVNGTHVSANFAPAFYFDNIENATSHFGSAGPTDFSVFDQKTEVYYSTLALHFGDSAAPGAYSFTASYSQQPDPGFPHHQDGSPLYPLFTTFYDGTAFVGAPVFEPSLSGVIYNDGLKHIVPTQGALASEVPEPGSLGLFAMGALGAARLRRRRRS